MRIAVPAARLKEIWDYLLADITVADSIGKLLKDDIDTKITLAKADLTTLETRLSALRAEYLDRISKYWKAVASEVLQHSNDAEKQTTSTDLVKLKEMKINDILDSVRLKYDGAQLTAGTAYTQVKINGVNEGAEQGEGAYATHSLDLSGLGPGDTVEVWGRKGLSTGVKVKNMRLNYDLTETAFKTAPTNQDP